MNNYVLLYYFNDKNIEQRFTKELKAMFERHTIEAGNGFDYFGFADRETPAVVDKINRLLGPIEVSFTMKDYVALYFSRKEDPDNIKRQMLLGHDSLIEAKVAKISFDAHRNSLTRLLEFNFLKAQPELHK